MLKIFFSIALFFCIAFSVKTVNAQDAVAKPAKTETIEDTTSKSKYINPGKVAARTAVIRSAIFPGLGQIYNYGLRVHDKNEDGSNNRHILQKAFVITKIAAIYASAYALTASFIDNNRIYHSTLSDVQYRQLNNDKSPAGSPYSKYTTTGLIAAKDNARRNKEVILFSYGALYAINMIDAYVDARLHFFNVDDKLSIKFSPTIINSNTMFSYNAATPAFKVSFKL